jgi:uncharacterized protein YecE (DUF72 family)
VEEPLPKRFCREYFEHFPVLEIDFTFYRPLLDHNGQPTSNYQVLKSYSRHLKEGDRILLKVPQMITAQKIRKGDQHIKNEAYLNIKYSASNGGGRRQHGYEPPFFPQLRDRSWSSFV